MKIRNGFVTNSSSSSFIIARNSQLSEKQKEEIINFVEHQMLGRLAATNKEELDAFFLKQFDLDVNDENWEDDYKAREYKEALEAINNGLSVYSDWVSFEDVDNGAELLTDLWERLRKVDKENFVDIDTSLDY